MKKIIFVIITFYLTACGSADTKQPDISALSTKQMLVIGDSISFGYLPTLSLPGYSIIHPDENCTRTQYGLNRIDAWLDNKNWDLVTFNFGMHDLKNSDLPPTSLAEYRTNLNTLIDAILPHTQRLVWVVTTDVPRFYSAGPDLASEHRAVAAEVMNERGIEMINLLPLSEEIRSEHDDYELENNVHYSEAGYHQLGLLMNSELRRIVRQ